MRCSGLFVSMYLASGGSSLFDVIFCLCDFVVASHCALLNWAVVGCGLLFLFQYSVLSVGPWLFSCWALSIGPFVGFVFLGVVCFVLGLICSLLGVVYWLLVCGRWVLIIVYCPLSSEHCKLSIEYWVFVVVF